MENPVSAGLQLLGCFSGGRVDKIFSGSFDKVFAGVCSADVVEVAAFFPSGAISPFPAGNVDCGDGDLSALPRIIGNPSLPEPTTTILVFLDWASSRVASMLRQVRYESEMPSLTIRWNSLIPSASIFLRSDSLISRANTKPVLLRNIILFN